MLQLKLPEQSLLNHCNLVFDDEKAPESHTADSGSTVEQAGCLNRRDRGKLICIRGFQAAPARAVHYGLLDHPELRLATPPEDDEKRLLNTTRDCKYPPFLLKNLSV